MQIDVASFASSQMANAITGTATARFLARLLFYRWFSEHAGEWQRQAKPPLACHFAAGIKRRDDRLGEFGNLYLLCLLPVVALAPANGITDRR